MQILGLIFIIWVCYLLFRKSRPSANDIDMIARRAALVRIEDGTVGLEFDPTDHRHRALAACVNEFRWTDADKVELEAAEEDHLERERARRGLDDDDDDEQPPQAPYVPEPRKSFDQLLAEHRAKRDAPQTLDEVRRIAAAPDLTHEAKLEDDQSWIDWCDVDRRN